MESLMCCIIDSIFILKEIDGSPASSKPRLWLSSHNIYRSYPTYKAIASTQHNNGH